MRAVTIAGATLALLGCCLFVMHAEDASMFESLKLGANPNAVLGEAEKKAAMAAGNIAQAPKLFKDPEIGPNFKGGKAKAGKTHGKYGKLATNCLALKAYSYVVADGVIESSFKDLGIVYNLLRAMTPTADPKKDNMSPVDCVKQYKGFVSTTEKMYTEKDSLPIKQLGAITHSMEKGGGILITLKKKDAKVITVNGKKLGLIDMKALSNLKGITALQSEVFHMLDKIEGGIGNGIANSIEHAKEDANLLNQAQEKALEGWNGK